MEKTERNPEFVRDSFGFLCGFARDAVFLLELIFLWYDFCKWIEKGELR